MSQELIFKKAKAALDTNDLATLRAIFNSTDEKPDSATTGKIMLSAAQLDKWDPVYEISQMEGDNKADETALAEVLEHAYNKNKKEEFVWICENSKTVPTQKAIKSLFDNAINSSSQYRWYYIEFLCFLKTGNKLGQDSINNALNEAFPYYRNRDLALKLVQMTGNNAPSKKEIAKFLEYTYTSNKVDTNNKFDDFKLICETTTPDQATLESLLQKAIEDSGIERWKYIEYLCFLETDNKPSQPIIDNALKEASFREQWDLVKRLVTMTGGNKPSQPAMDQALLNLYGKDLFNEFVSFIEQSTTSPSQAAIESLLDKAINSSSVWRWNYIDYLCSLKTGNMPRQEFIDNALNEATLRNWDLALKLVKMTGDNAPSKKAIASFLEYTYRNNKFDDFKRVFESTPPNQNTVEFLLQKAIEDSGKERWKYIEYLCFLEKDNKPSQPLIDNALKEASFRKRWDLVLRLVQINKGNQPSQSAIDEALPRLYGENLFDHFVAFIEKSTTSPSQTAIESLLNKAIVSSSVWRWSYIDYLCSLKTDNKPRQESINNALEEASINSRNWQLAQKLIQMSGDNAPSGTSIAYALQQAYKNNKFDEFKFIWEQSTTPPRGATLVLLLHAAIADTGPNRWKFIHYLCFLNSENKPKPRQTSIDKALIEAATQARWDFAVMLLRMKADNQPSQTGIEFLFEAAAGANEVHLMEEICSLPPDRQPRNPSIGKALGRAAKAGHLEAVTFFSEMKSDTKPSPQSYIDAYIMAASNNKIGILHYLGTLSILSQQTIDLALAGAAEKGGLITIVFIFSDKNPIRPTQEGIENAFIKAVSVGYLMAVEYFIDPKNKIVLKPEVIDKAMQTATSVGNDSIIQRLKPIQQAMKPTLPKTEFRVAAVQTEKTKFDLPKTEPRVAAFRIEKTPVKSKPTAVKSNPSAAKLDLLKASVKPTASARLDQLSEIRKAVAKAQSLYQEWYEDKDGKKNIRCANGFFSHWWFRHGVNGQIRAKNILKKVNNPEITAKNAADILNTFLQDSGTAYHRHSFSSFLLDELKKIKEGPWSSIKFNASYHYDQNDVIKHLQAFLKQETKADRGLGR